MTKTDSNKIVEVEIALSELDPRVYSRPSGPDFMALYLTQKTHNWRIVEMPTHCGLNLHWIEFTRDLYGRLIGYDCGCVVCDCPIETIWKKEDK